MPSTVQDATSYPEDRRRSSRQDVKVSTRLSLSVQTWEGMTRNPSIGGLYVTAPATVSASEGQRIDMASSPTSVSSNSPAAFDECAILRRESLAGMRVVSGALPSSLPRYPTLRRRSYDLPRGPRRTDDVVDHRHFARSSRAGSVASRNQGGADGRA